MVQCRTDGWFALLWRRGKRRASFLQSDGSVWTTDKDGIVLGLLAAEITATTGHDPGTFYDAVTCELGTSFYQRMDAPASASQKRRLAGANADEFRARELAGEAVDSTLTRAPGNQEPIGGIKVIARSGWFAARPSGTEKVYKIYAESFRSEKHLEQIQRDAQTAVAEFFDASGLAKRDQA
jgi:phosphoglucomutase